MNCEELKPLWVEWLYGELPAHDRSRLEAHLADCDACRAAVAELRQGRDLLDLVPADEVRLDLAKLCLRLANEAQRSRRRWRVGTLAACAAGVVVTAAAAFATRIEVHQDRLVVAWRDAPAAQPPAPANPSSTGQAAPTTSHPDLRPTPPANKRSGFAWPRFAQGDSPHRGGYLSLRDEVLARGVDALAAPPNPGHPQSTGGPPAPSTYNDLRREWLGPNAIQPVPPKSPEA